jgi:hypothetical protein
MSALIQKLKQLGEKSKSKTTSPVSRPARTNTRSSIKPQPAIQTLAQAVKTMDQKPSLVALIKNSNYDRCIVAYTNNHPNFKDIYNRALSLSIDLQTYEETKLDNIVVADSGEVSKDYLLKASTNNKISFFYDSYNDALVLKHPSFYEIFVSNEDEEFEEE